jgi:hypothetical protein
MVRQYCYRCNRDQAVAGISPLDQLHRGLRSMLREPNQRTVMPKARQSSPRGKLSAACSARGISNPLVILSAAKDLLFARSETRD